MNIPDKNKYILPKQKDEVADPDDWGMELKDTLINNDTGIPELLKTMSSLKHVFFDFIEETGSLLEDIKSSVLRLEKDNNNLDIVNDMFRSFHSIKGNCGYLGIKEMGRLCHKIESMLDDTRSRDLPVTKGFIDLIAEVVDALNKMRIELPYSLRDKFSLTESELSKYPSCNPADINPLLQKIDMHLYKEPPNKDTYALPMIGEILLASGVINDEQLNRALKLQERKLGEILVDEGFVPADKVKTAIDIQKSKESQIKTPAGSIKVATERIGTLADLIGELVTAQTLINMNPSVVRISDQNLQKAVSHLGKITREIQDLVMSLRMMPLKQTFQKLMWVVRDIANKEGKLVDFVASGEDTELDRNVIEEISDPLIHILRNSVNHGIETPDERIRNGKPEKGVVYLDAFHRCGSVVIEIRDDGRGICTDKVLRKAIEKGFTESDADITEQQIHNLIFQPGISTAELVTDIAGRGVGLDVVRRNIENIHGQIDLKSKEGEGTSISIVIPLTGYF